MASHIVEIVGPNGYAERQVEVELDYDPNASAYKVRELIRNIVWEHGAEFHPIEGEDAYAGWSRFSINISPPGESELE